MNTICNIFNNIIAATQILFVCAGIPALFGLLIYGAYNVSAPCLIAAVAVASVAMTIICVYDALYE